jgi:hypothetical protein
VSGQRRKPNKRRGGRGNSGNNGNNGANKAVLPADFWRAAPEPPEPPDIVPANDPTALLRSMGPPPLPGQQNVALPYLEAVAQRAAILATALAASADLLDDGAED